MDYFADRLSVRRNEHPRSCGPSPRVDLARIHLGGSPVRNGGSGKRERLELAQNESRDDVDWATHRRLERSRRTQHEERSKNINNAQIATTVLISIRPKCPVNFVLRLRKYGTWEIASDVKKNAREIELATRTSRSLAPSCSFGSMNADNTV